MSELLLKAIRTISGMSKLRLEPDPPVTEIKMDSKSEGASGVGTLGVLASVVALLLSSGATVVVGAGSVLESGIAGVDSAGVIAVDSFA